MPPRTDLAAALAVATVAAAVLLGGAFWPLERVAVGCLLAIVVAVALRLGARAWSRAERWAALLVGWALVSAVTSAHDWLAAREAVTALAAAVAVWIVVRRAGAILPILAGVVVAVGTAVSLTVLGNAMSSTLHRSGGVFDSPNLAAAVLVPTLPIALTVLPTAWLRWLVTAALVAATVLSGSRAGVIAAAVAVVTLIPRGRGRVVLSALAAVAAAAAVGWRLRMVPDPLAWYRVSIWGALGRLLLAHPLLGVGPGSLADATGPVRLAQLDRLLIHEHVIGAAESTPLAIAVTLGVIGFALVGAVAWAWWRESRRDGDQPALRWRGGVIAAIVVMAAVHDALAAEPLLWWWAMLLGLAAPLLSTPPNQHRPWGWPAALAGFALVIWGMVNPNLARAVWRAAQPSAERAAAVERLEPWLSTPLEWRLGELLSEPRWSWASAAEAGALAERWVTVQPGVWSAWQRAGEVAARTAVELGAAPATIDRARAAFDRAAELEPRLPWPWLARARFERLIAGGAAAQPFIARALEAEPHCAPAWALGAQVALADGRLGEARDALDEVEAARVAWQKVAHSRYAHDVLTVPQWQLERLQRELK